MVGGKAVFKRKHIVPGTQCQLAGKNPRIPQLPAGVAAAVAVQHRVAAVMPVFQADPFGGQTVDIQRIAADAQGGGHQLGKQLLRGALMLQVLRGG